ncbi:MAG: peptidoglycan recognition protein family protein [Actinomycetota bacterium]
MGQLPRRPLVVAALAVLLAGAGAVVPVRMAWSAPELRYLELAAPSAPTMPVPFRRLALPVARTRSVPFAATHLGVRWTGAEDAGVEVRTAPATGRWGPWRAVEVAHDLGSEERRRVVSGLLRVDGARQVQVRAGGEARSLRVAVIDAEHGPRHLVRDRPAGAGAQAAEPAVVPRSAWGADESLRRAPPAFAPVDRMVVHHTVTPNDDPDPAATMRAMYAFHVRGNGWDDIGYNFVIDGAGRVYEGRHARVYGSGETPDGESAAGHGVIGAHAEDQNAGSVGVALLGTFTDRAPAPPALDALQRVLAWKADRHGMDPAGSARWAGGRVVPTIAGHRDVGSTSCPGDLLYARLPELRRTVAAAVAAARVARTPGYWAVGRDGRVLGFGRAPALLAPLAAPLAAPAAAMAATPSGQGYWVATDAGRVLPFGDALPLGSPELLGLLGPAGRPVALEATPSGLGYWVAEEGGRVRPFGDALDHGAAPGPVVDMARTPTGRGYWLAAADGRVSAHGDAPDLGSAAGRARAPVVAIAATPSGRGYWLAAADGTVLTFGDARRAGGPAGRGGAARVVDLRPTPSGRGYYVLAADGGLFAFGDAAFHGAPTALAPGAVGLALAR